MSPISWDSSSGKIELTGRLLRVCTKRLQGLRELAGFDGASTWLWPRWFFLRGIGLIVSLICLDYLRFGQGMIGVNGVLPYTDFVNHLVHDHGAAAGFLEAPSVLWLSSAPFMLTAVNSIGLASAILLLFNVAPRITAVIAWAMLLSLSNLGQQFSSYQHDYLIAESLFLGIFLAPSGFRPGLGQTSPPHRIVIALVRWLLLRLMFQSGMGKILAHDPHLVDFTIMDIHQETSPLPTFFGYLDHHLPHWYHLGQIGLLFVAELLAPLLAFQGRTGRIAAFLLWTVFQGGIELTGNYGFLNFNAMLLGLTNLAVTLSGGDSCTATASATNRGVPGRV